MTNRNVIWEIDKKEVSDISLEDGLIEFHGQNFHICIENPGTIEESVSINGLYVTKE